MQARNAWILTCCGIIVALPCVMALLIIKTGVDIPSWDEWEYADFVYRLHLGTLSFADLWAQHNEHRIFFPALITVTLARLGGWNPVREQLVSLVFLVLTQIGVLALIKRCARGSIAWGTAALASILLYGLWQSENFAWGFQLGWFICNASALTVVVRLTRPHRSGVDVALSAIVAMIGSFSLSTGLLTWGVGIVAILLVPRRAIATLCFWIPCAIGTYVVYAYEMKPLATGHLDIGHHPLLVIHYACIYYGAPLAGWLGPNASALAGAVVCIGVAVAIAWDVRRSRHLVYLVRRAPWYALATYPLAAGILTAFGRAGFGVAQATASRYTSAGGLLWIALFGIVATYAKRNRSTRPATGPLIAALAIASILGFAIIGSEREGWQSWIETESRLVTGWHGAEEGDPDTELILYPSRARLEMLIGELKSVSDGPFLGQNVSFEHQRYLNGKRRPVAVFRNGQQAERMRAATQSASRCTRLETAPPVIRSSHLDDVGARNSHDGRFRHVATIDRDEHLGKGSRCRRVKHPAGDDDVGTRASAKRAV